MNDKQKEIIIRAIRNSGTCWKNSLGAFTGVFNSEKAATICDQLIKDLDEFESSKSVYSKPT